MSLTTQWSVGSRFFMFRVAVVYTGLLLLVSTILVFAAGHRTKVAHWAWSQLLLFAVAISAWIVQASLTGEAPPFVASMLVVFVVGTAITAWCEDWNPLAHSNFAAVVLSVASFFLYAIFVLVQAHLGPASFSLGVILLVLQAAVLVLLVAHTFEILDVVCRTRWRRPFGVRMVPGYCPKVSIHVPTHNEPPELVIGTLNALAALDYPNFEVLVIDNNTNDESLWRPVEEHCRQLGARFRFFHLLPWPGFKSGALNFALDQVATDTEIIGIVDADYVVSPHYLKDLIGHFAKPDVAFVQTPQDYRDHAERGRYGRALYLSYRYFFAVSMHCRNERDAIIFAGTMGLIRRDALIQVGKWDEWCITEDAEVSLRLLNAGYRSVYVDRTYGRGLMPLDYAALKKQRFRWAFGGMQLLRMHARTILRRGSGQLSAAQRLSYLSGGLQWLNDPLTVSFSLILLIAAATFIGGGSLYLQPLVGATILIPPLLILFGVMRFLWAFRVRAECSWRDALDAFVMLLGLTWVVALACIQGLTAKRGVFLRTPKQSERPRLVEIARVVWFEGVLAAASLVACVLIVASHPLQPLSARSVFLMMLGWQFVIYASAVQSGLWSYQAYRSATPSAIDRLLLSPVRGYVGRAFPEWRMIGAVAVAAIGLSMLLRMAILSAPGLEQVWRADPLGEFVKADTLIQPQPFETLGAQLVREADAARRQDIASVLALWDPEGVITDAMFTPDVPEDDVIWTGAAGIRTRYEREFRLRHYRELRHLNLKVTFHGADEAAIVNDLDALVESDQTAERIRLGGSDRWTLRRRDGRWRIVMLEVNRASRPPNSTARLVEDKP